MGGDLNMVEHEADRSGNPPKKLSREEQDGWDNLILKLGLEDNWESDDFTHHDSLRFSWTNKQQDLSHLMARLDRFYVGEWRRNRGGKLEILAGFNTLSDHVPVHLHIRRKSLHQKENRSFRFNTSFLEDEFLVQKLAATWSEEPRPTGDETWALWVVRAQLRIREFCQREGKQRAQARRDREAQLRGTSASTERLLEQDPTNRTLQATLAAARHELLEKEQKSAEWKALHSSARWAQIEGRMDGAFFEGVHEHHTKTSIPTLTDPTGKEYSTNVEMASYANTYYHELFSTEGCSPACTQAREFCWAQVPKTVTPDMNVSLTRPLSEDEILQAFKALQTGKTPGMDGLPPEFFLKLWNLVSTDLLKVFNEALQKGTLCRDLNTGLLCLIPKGG
ncbi:hypothetical protein KC19_VG162200 [Ceratodon purpureus]|uniref:Reverse transcriptase n=1 Tax=Ceratodon purpureus TaxID=3225 RepID=A0A8T0HR93_CERPU|nr:hypothetical protein KC19_VG162200 [Ceratodon purpureus]